MEARQFSSVVVQAFADKHRLGGPVAPMTRLGIINDIWSVGDAVIRIPTQADYEPTLYAESVAVPAALRAGVDTPRILAFDDDRDIVDAPVMVTERFWGETLGTCAVFETWEEADGQWAKVTDDLGRMVARLHEVQAVDDPGGRLNPWWADDPVAETAAQADQDRLDPAEAAWLQGWLSRLASAFTYDPLGPPDSRVFVHHDLHPFNVMVGDDRTVVLDWGGACWGDPAVDFSGFPLWALPPLIDAYRRAGGKTDEGFEARALWMWASVAVSEPSFLEPAVFPRPWWRLPVDGVPELRWRLEALPAAWKVWNS